MTNQLSELLAELSVVQDELIATAEDDFERRMELHRRQDELRAKARELGTTAAVGGVDATEIRRQIARLEAERERHISNRLPYTAAAQTGMGGGIDPRHVHQMHRQMDDAFGLVELDEELARLRHRLTELEA